MAINLGQTVAPSWHYFVAYSHPRGLGMTEVACLAPITDYDVLATLASQLAEKNRMEWVVITNFQLLRVDGLESGDRAVGSHPAEVS